MIPKYLAGYALLAAALCAALTGCEPGDGTEPSPEPGPAVSAPQSTGTALPETDLYLAAARAVAPGLETVPDSDLIELGQSVCAAFDAGATTAEIGVTMISSGLDATASGAVVGSATGASGLCPEHGDAARGE
ncbi:hypothetical protein SEA_LAZERLEMON_41 [Streptomyces phage LazerLemon]|nr:hypothetical protein SEA_LAZERLEMON_41 [Streptomyces phage LazerLemon]